MTIWPRRATALAIVVLLVAAFDPAAVGAEGGGRIDGQVINGTAGAPSPASLRVTVHIFQDRSKIGEQVVETDGAGHFMLLGLDIGSGKLYFPVVEYGGASYFPERPIVLDDATAKSVEIRIFEPSSSDDAIAFDRANLLVLGVTPTALSVMQMGAVVNRSDRTYVGGSGADPASREPTLRFPLPSGAAQVTPQAGLSPGELTSTADGFASTGPVLPGRHELAFSYQIPIDGPTLDITAPQAYPTGAFNLYLPATGLSASSPQLRFQGTSELGGQRYQLYSAEELPRGAQVSIRLSGLPAAFRPRPQQLSLVVLGASSVVLACGALVALRRRPPRVAAVGAGDLTSGPLDPERLTLVRALAELDERYAAGEIDESQYREQRQRDKARLVALLQSSSPG
ncbi:MAG TPA: SHOCT domain-containing protein [Chloroflexota bacterium]|nr:SHOCT domain-containing protein [Chloroflexota bacterium]